MSKKAPEPLNLVQDYVNSADLEEGREDFASPEGLRDWLAERDLMRRAEPVSEGDLRRAIDVREGLRAVLLANSGHELDGAAVERLNLAASRAGLRVVARTDAEMALEPDASGVDGAIGRLLAVVTRATADGSWERLKACVLDSCHWAFYDNSKNRSGKWCKMEVCGNVEKARAYRERQRQAAS
jgi:predicted RNA-binding Zn ribbon-like protein